LVFSFLLALCLAPEAQAQAPAPQPNQSLKPARKEIPPAGEWIVRAASQTVEGNWRRLRGSAEMESFDMLFRADELDYNEENGNLEARGNIFFQHFARDERIWADRLEYNTETETGKFYNVRGEARPRIDARPGVLTSTNPFYFQGEWAERVGNKYILHDGFLTNCKVPRPWWRLKGPRFDIVPGDRAIARNSIFYVKKIPIFYTPFFYKSLERVPRRSGLLTPNIGNSSRRGKMLGIGYYWAVNRSYDVTYRIQNFTQRGFAHNVDVRGKPRAGTDFNAIFYGVQDRGYKLESGDRIKQGGVSFYMSGASELGRGFQARGEVNYISSLIFRQAFTESFNEAIFSESHSTGFISRKWSSFTFHAVMARLETFQSAEPGDSIVIRRLPEFEFTSRDRQVRKDIPVWVSLTSSVGLLRRTQPLFQTRQFTERADFQPRVMTALRWRDFHLIPSFSVRETHYGESQHEGRIAGGNVLRSAREFNVELIAPALARIFDRPTFLGEKLKHVIEPRASFRYVAGVEDFERIVRFDETDLLTNTQEAEFGVINRLFAKRGGAVSEVLSWELWQRRYFDPTFGGAVVEGRRNVVRSAVEMTAYNFVDGSRRVSPVVSVLRATPRPGFGLEWRTDYDTLRGGIVNSGFTADMRLSRYFISAGHNHVRSSRLLTPPANQFRGLIGFGQENRRGWNAGFSAVYDYRVKSLQYVLSQVTYNTDCCGLSVQYRRFSFGARDEHQFRLAFAVANIGSFGTLKKQERLF
jgi:LPS-assembly protein